MKKRLGIIAVGVIVDQILKLIILIQLEHQDKQ